MTNIALILLGGSGNRVGGEIPKQFITKNDIPLYIYALKRYEDVPLISDIVLVVNQDYIDKVKQDIKTYDIKKVKDVIIGGKERFISSYLGIKRCLELFPNDSNILIADAARVNTSSIIILANIFALNDAKAVLTAIRGRNEGERIDTAHIRGNVSLLAQTPQSFKLGYIHDLYEKFIFKDYFFPTDDINVVELAREDYVVVEGDEENYKITTKNDLNRFLNS